mgnify:CR=1 FL=1
MPRRRYLICLINLLRKQNTQVESIEGDAECSCIAVHELSNTVFGGRQNNQFWQTIFSTGSTPQGYKVLVNPLNLNQLQISK